MFLPKTKPRKSVVHFFATSSAWSESNCTRPVSWNGPEAGKLWIEKQKLVKWHGLCVWNYPKIKWSYMVEDYIYIYISMTLWKYSLGFIMKLQLATSSHLIHLHTCTALKLNYSKIEMIAPAFQTWNGLERVLVFRIWAGFQHAYLKMLSKKGRDNPRPYGGWP